MKRVHFVFGLHNHQPIGNFESVFIEAHDKSYLPFLELLEKHPNIKVTQHYTGILFDWLVKHRPKVIAKLKALVQRGQIEMMTGGFYEPIMPVIPEGDRIKQIKRLTEFVKEHTGYDAKGMWLAERVWEPSLTKSLAQAGVRYTVLDDSHFKATGLNDEQTLGYYSTEDTGHTMAIFPISEKLRYTIPFMEPQETIDYLRSIATEDGQTIAVMADDGEKFGVWPKTFKRCYEDGYLEQLFRALEANKEWINVTTFSDVMNAVRPKGRLYLPTASYIEMMEWAMPAKAILGYEHFTEELREKKMYEENKTFVRGGFWRNFFAKYDESNHIHKRMLNVSRRLERLEGDTKHNANTALKTAREHLMAGQCNCAYWHGVFGGLYLCNLRNGLYSNLLKADATMDKVEFAGKPYIEIEEADFDADLRGEVIISTDRHKLIVKPDQGGQIIEHDWKPSAVNLTDTLTRRFEPYHQKVKMAISREEADRQEGTPSIHGAPITKEANLERFLNYDWYRRSSLVDHFLGEKATLDNFMAANYPEDGNFVNQAYQAKLDRKADSLTLTLARDGQVYPSGGPLKVRVEKAMTVTAGSDKVTWHYTISNRDTRALTTRFGVEFVVNFLAGNEPDRLFLNVDAAKENPRLHQKGTQSGMSEFGLTDAWLNVKCLWSVDKPADVWRMPIETVSNSEAGFERVFQGNAMMPIWPVSLAAGASWSVTITQSLSHLHTGPVQ